MAIDTRPQLAFTTHVNNQRLRTPPIRVFLRRAVALLLLSEVVGVDAFDLIRGRHRYADIVLNQHRVTTSFWENCTVGPARSCVRSQVAGRVRDRRELVGARSVDARAVNSTCNIR